MGIGDWGLGIGGLGGWAKNQTKTPKKHKPKPQKKKKNYK